MAEQVANKRVHCQTKIAPLESPYRMATHDPKKDYYGVLGVDERATKAEIDRQYKRQAAKHHPDLGGNEERMKSLNEAYGILKDQALRRNYDRSRQYQTPAPNFVPVSTPAARDVGAFGHCLSALLCLISGFFLLMLVRFQWIWFLWPLAILAVLVVLFGIVMARGTMRAIADTMPVTKRVRGFRRLQEMLFWCAVLAGCYGVYLLLTAL